MAGPDNHDNLLNSSIRQDRILLNVAVPSMERESDQCSDQTSFLAQYLIAFRTALLPIPGRCYAVVTLRVLTAAAGASGLWRPQSAPTGTLRPWGPPHHAVRTQLPPEACCLGSDAPGFTGAAASCVVHNGRPVLLHWEFGPLIDVCGCKCA